MPADRTALLCSPSSTDCQLLASALDGLDFTVAQVRNAIDAVRLARENRCALILVDLDNDVHWKSTLQVLGRVSPESALLAYSRLPEERLWLDALDAGAFDFVCKPFHGAELRWILENALKNRTRFAAA